MPGDLKTTSRPFDVAVAGHICLDIIPEFPHSEAASLSDFLTPGKLLEMGRLTLSSGGPVSNTGIALHLFGHSVAFMARLGEDELGQWLIDRLQKEGCADGVTIAPGEGTSYTNVIAPTGIDRIFLHYPGANSSFTSRDVDFTLVEKCRIFHLGYPPLMRSLYINEGEELVRCFQLAKEAGATTSLDMSLPDPAAEAGKVDWRRILEKLLPHVDIFLPSIEEACSMLDPESFWPRRRKAGGAAVVDEIAPSEYSRAAKAFLDMGCRMTSLKSGHRGFYFRTASEKVLEDMGAAGPSSLSGWADRELWAPAINLEHIASATGSGDSAIAGFLAAFLRGYPLERCLCLANMVGYFNLQRLDALSGLKPWGEILDFLDSGSYEIVDPRIDEEGWNYDSSRRIFLGPLDGSH